MLLRAENIRKIYRTSGGGAPLHVLKGLDLTIEPGEVMAIVGPSGAGKSTLLHILGGLDRPSEGKVIMGGQDIYALADHKRARIRNEKAGFVFQFYHLLPEMTALENVALPRMILEDKSHPSQVQDFAFDLLERVGLKDRAEHKPSQMSGGEQQRVAIARALMNNPEIVFCDEPTGNLDSESSDGIIRLLLELNKDNRQTLIIVTHDKEIARRAARTIYIRDGKIQDNTATNGRSL